MPRYDVTISFTIQADNPDAAFARASDIAHLATIEPDFAIVDFVGEEQPLHDVKNHINTAQKEPNTEQKEQFLDAVEGWYLNA